jgi:hypothetical protein
MVDPVSGGGSISLDTVGALSGKMFTATWDRSGNRTDFAVTRIPL